MAQQSGNHTAHCPACEKPQRARNHYFTGKLLVERDFSDEQKYLVGRDRRHNQVLHGWGTACGLGVYQHPQEVCRDQYVVIQPGTAIDCCGNEILVECEELFDFRSAFLDAWRAQHDDPETLADESVPGEPQTFQICIRHHECPTEPIPALYDDCACGEEACQPNRIKDSFALDVVLDPENLVEGPRGKDLEWRCSVNLAQARDLAVDPRQGRLYVASRETRTLYIASLDTKRVLASRSVADAGVLDLAVAGEGDRVYLLVQPDTAGSDPQLLVLDSADIAGTPVQAIDLVNVGADRPRLAPSPDGRLLLADPANDRILLFGNDVNGPGPSTPLEEVAAEAVADLAVTSDGSLLFATVRGAAPALLAIDLSDPTQVDRLDLPASSEPDALSLLSTPTGVLVAFSERSANAVLLAAHDVSHADPLDFHGDEIADVSDGEIIDLALSEGGNWVYVLLVGADGLGMVQAVDVRAAQSGDPSGYGSALKVGAEPGELLLADGKLFIAYEGDDTAEDAGGVAVVSALSDDCCGLLDRVLDDCIGCSEGGECVVLATIEGYSVGDALIDAAGQLDVGEVAIDNRTGRRLLPSTQLLTEIVQCLCARQAGSGGGEGIAGLPGADGDDGEDGEDGAGIDDVEVSFVDCETPGSAAIQDTPAGRILSLEIPSCCQDVPLTRICGISWPHGEGLTSGALSLVPFFPDRSILPPRVASLGEMDGLLVAFDNPVRNGDIHSGSFRVWVSRQGRLQPGLVQWLQLMPPGLEGLLAGARLETAPLGGPSGGCKIERVISLPPDPDDAVNGLVFIVPRFAEGSATFGALNRVELIGDLVRDHNGTSVDADHLAPWVPQSLSGDGIAGGRFESQFHFIRLNVNEVGVDDLASLAGLSRRQAELIVRRREVEGPFSKVEDLRDIDGIGEATMRKISSFVVVR